MSYLLGIPGGMLWAYAIHLLSDAMAMEITVATPGVEQFSNGLDRVVNMQLMHLQAMNVSLGIGAALAGTIMICTALLIASQQPKRSAEPSE